MIMSGKTEKKTTENQKNPVSRKHRAIGLLLFLLYLMLLTYFLFFSEGMGRTERADVRYRYNLRLFHEIRRFWKFRHVVGLKTFLINTAGNVAAFVPFGFFLPAVTEKSRVFLRTLLSGFLFSFLIEVVQCLTGAGIFDVDDIFLNSLGCALGYLSFAAVMKVRSMRG